MLTEPILQILPAIAAETGGVEDARLPSLTWMAFGLTAQLLFSARMVVQVLASRKRKESYTPPAFWYISFTAGTLLAIYCFARSDPVALLQQAVMIAIYIRNLYLIRKEQRGDRFNRRAAKIAASIIYALCGVLLVWALYTWERSDINPDTFSVPGTDIQLPALLVLGWGFIGMAIFAGRFFIQWLAAERAKKSVVPASFWVMGSIGSVMLLVYFILRHDPPLILGQVTALPAFLYNLVLIRRKRREASTQQ